MRAECIRARACYAAQMECAITTRPQGVDVLLVGGHEYAG